MPKKQNLLVDVWQIVQNFLSKLRLQRTLLRKMVVRDLKSRYVGSMMGLFWSVIHPVVLLLTYTFVFSVILKMKPWQDAGTDSFPIFMFSGILPWLLFSDTVTRSATAVIDSSALVKKTKFPVEIVPLSLFFANLFSHAIGLAILLVVLFLGQGLGWWALFLPVYWMCLFLLVVGLGWIVAVLQVFLRDTSQVLNVLMTLGFWFTPIFYSVDLVPPTWRSWMWLNPMAAVVTGYRRALLLNSKPDLIPLAALVVISLAVFVAGGILFRVAKREFADVL
jgi:lipopolysaccharide transport system permease protein